MKRRPFLLTGALAGLAPIRSTWGQPGPTQRAAVVIGVDQAGGLPKLQAAASGARQVEALLKTEGYDVAALVDERAPVTLEQVFDAIDRYVSKGTIEQLVVFFAGHGFAAEYVEYWLLSDATRNPNQSISLRESVQRARLYSGIPNVIFISDACRSTPSSLGFTGIHGGVIFPTASSVQPSDVDQFMATLVGDPSFEVEMTKSTKNYAGIYTTTLLSAFAEAPIDIVSKVGGANVVPNKRLKRFLEREVPRRAQQIKITLNQRPDAQVTSGDEIFIAKAARTTKAALLGAASSLRHVAAQKFSAVGLQGIMKTEEIEIKKYPQATQDLGAKTGFTKAQVEMSMQIKQGQKFAGALPATQGTGFLVSGQPIKEALLLLDGKMQPFRRLDAQAIAADVPPGRAASALIQFADGSSTVVAALHDFAGHIVVAGNGVINVSYVRRGGRVDPYRLNELHASVATAARFGVFRIEREEWGSKGTVSVLASSKGTVPVLASVGADKLVESKDNEVDPTLGVYAAYAYSEAGIEHEVASVRSIMRRGLDFDLFDTAMLSGALGKKGATLRTCAPFCPMLAQGWALLRVNNVQLPKEIQSCRDYLRPALWTTLEPKGTDLLLDALRSGRLEI